MIPLIKNSICIAAVNSLLLLSQLPQLSYCQFKAPAAPVKELYVRNDSNYTFAERSALFLPVCPVEIIYINDTKTIEKKEFPDSFFIEAAHELINYECIKRFNICITPQMPGEGQDTLFTGQPLRYSILKHDTTELNAVSQRIQQLANKAHADFVLVPYSCILKNVVFQQKAWRQETSNTARPIRYIAKTEILLQLWDGNGTLLYEKVGRAQTKRPILYKVFKKKRLKEDEEMVDFTKHAFSPPLVKSLSEAIVDALEMQK